MKKVLLVLVMCFASAYAWSQAASITIASARSYAATDTTPVATVKPGAWTLAFWATDTINVTVTLQYSLANTLALTNGAVWASYAVVSDSTNSKVHAGYLKTVVLRGYSADNFPGATRVRIIVTRKTTGNPVVAGTYSAVLLSQ